MAFESFSDFMMMCIDGRCHGLYVWSAYSIGLGVVVFNIVSPILMKNKLIADQKRRIRREQS